MPEFERYLAALREELQLSRGRADEIVAEVRTHLENAAAESQAQGLSRDEAVAAAERDFGAPAELAGRLTKANGRHRRPAAFRILLSLAVAFAATIAAVALLYEQVPPPGIIIWTRGHLPFPQTAADTLVLALVLVPATVLAGVVAGRRFWWLGAAPLVLWGLAFCVITFVTGARGTPIGWAVLYVPVIGALLLGPAAYAGSRLCGSRSGQTWTSAVGAVYTVALLGLAAKVDLGDAFGWHVVLAIAGALLCIVALALYRDSRPGRLNVWAATAACAAAIMLVVMLAVLAATTEGRLPGWNNMWRTAAMVELSLGAAALVAFLSRRVRIAGRWPAPHAVAGALVLLAVGAPTWSRVSAARGDEHCIVHLHEILRAMAMYAEDYADALPVCPAPPQELGTDFPELSDEQREAFLQKERAYLEGLDARLIRAYAPYLSDRDAWYCPRQPRPATPEEGRGIDHYAGLGNPFYLTYVYDWPARLEPPRQVEGHRALVDRVIEDALLMNTGPAEPPVAPHGGGKNHCLNVGFLDGHVESLTVEAMGVRSKEDDALSARHLEGASQ